MSRSTTPTSAPSPPENPIAADAALTRTLISKEVIDASNEVLIIAHSAGTISSLLAAPGLLRSDRSTHGLNGGIIGFIIIAGVVRSDEPPLRPRGEYDPTAIVEGDRQYFPTWHSVFYTDLPAPEAARRNALLVPVASGVFWEEIPKLKGLDGAEIVYVLAEEDQILPASFQEEAAEKLKGLGARVEVRRVKSGHSVMLSMPGKIVDVVEEVVGAGNGGRGGGRSRLLRGGKNLMEEMVGEGGREGCTL